jgi:hypothetical protein
MNDDKKAHFEVLKDYKDSISWVLEKQAELRAELLVFYKKDLKEIQSSLVSISDEESSKDFNQKALDNVQKFFLDEWKRSFDMISPLTDNSSASLATPPKPKLPPPMTT